RQVAIGFIEDHELVAVETRQPFIGPEPEESVGSLRDGSDGILRKPVLLVPNQAGILREALAGVERGGTPWKHKDRQGRGPDRPAIARDSSFHSAIQYSAA